MTTMRTLLVAATAGLLGTAVALHSNPPVAHATPSTAVLTDSSIPDVAERVVDSVVNISTSRSMPRGPAAMDPFFTDPDSPGYGDLDGQAAKATALGSGVIVNGTGRILTNAHVVNGADDIKVSLHDGSELAAKVVGIDPKADLAVIQLQGKVPALHALAFGDSSSLRLGEVVLAIGDPFGVGKSVTMGIVSAKGRSGMGIEQYEDFIQTDAAINPGNSGGALVNLKGELVGINTAIASRSGGYAGIGFAIPTNMARPIVEELVATGKVKRGYLGVGLVTATPELAKQYRLGAPRGVAIGEVQSDSPAARAGLVMGDVITAMNGTEVKTREALTYQIGSLKPGTMVDLEIAHAKTGKAVLKVKLGETPTEDGPSIQQLVPGHRRR
jgi:serine protease Do